MKARPVRIVLAFYPSEEGPSERIRKSLEPVSRICIVRGDTREIPRSYSRYAPLRVEGETLLIAETPAAKLETVVKYLRVSGSPAIFVVRPEFVSGVENEGPPSAEIPGDRSALTKATIVARLEKSKAELQAARQDLVDANRLEHALSPAAEWILDNSYLIHTQINEVQRHLPRDYSAWAGARNGHGDVWSVARELVSKADYVVTEASIREHLELAQTPAPFTIAELWAFPLFLRIALVEELTRLSVAVKHGQQLRESAYLWANRLASSSRAGSEAFEAMLRHLETEPIARQPHFVTTLAERLQDEELALGPAQQWIEQQFGKSLIEVVRAQHTREAAETVSTANAFGSLRALSRIDFKNTFEDVSLVEAELRKDPAGTYRQSDFQTRDRSRRMVEKMAQYSSLDELEVARRAVRLAQESPDPASGHVTYYLLSAGLPQLEKETNARIPLGARTLRAICRHATPLYLEAILGLTTCFAVLSWLLAREAGVHQLPILIALTALSILPLSELCIQIVNAFVIALLPPDPLPKLDFREGIPAEHATLVVIPMMLSSQDVIRTEIEKLEVRFLGNRNANIFYSLFPDFTDSAEPSTTEDADLLQTARNGIAELNRHYPLAPEQDGDRFLLFHRPRVWSESEQLWIGRERKRGKLEELNAFLVGTAGTNNPGSNKGILDTGRLPLRIAYVLTLDADTQLPADTGRRLIETIAHPLNRVVIDPQTGIRKQGYTIIQPRVSITLPGATVTRFTRIFADATGTDPYSQTVSDAQQDLFLEAIYHGKAIYDVQAFHTILGDRFPPEALLSHDLIEGAHVGVGLASDIELFEHLPTGYGGFASRQHRWIRGDWQIARWAMRLAPGSSGALQHNPLSLINRWRILDNLRRSLVPIAALLLLLLGWLTNAAPGVWSLVVGLAVAIPAITPLLERLARRVQGSVYRWQGAADELIRAVVMIAFLPHQAWLSADAIARVFYRRHISRRKLLEWHTAEHAKANAHRHSDAALRQLTVISGLSVLLIIGLLVEGEFAPTAFFVLLWAASPLLMRWMGHPGRSLARKTLSGGETLFLRGVARATWRYFDDLVGPETNWLPPDNSQLALRVEVARRTSPTNIGLWLTSALTARDFGYLTADEFCLRCSRTLDTLTRMEHYEGHLLNWYDTHTLEPLNPSYVSTVDSGNLIAALWVLEQGCNDLLRAPVIGHAGLRGLYDTLSILQEKCGDDPSAAVSMHALRRLLRGAKEGHELIGRYRMAAAPVQKLHESQRWHVEGTDERTYWASRLSSGLALWTTVADRYLQWMETLAAPPDSLLAPIGKDAVRLRRRALHQIPSLLSLSENSIAPIDSILFWRTRPDLRPEVTAWLDQLGAEYATAKQNAAESVAALRRLMADAAKIADGINMRFLYDAGRRLFGVGYAVGGPREFASHYDLLASECRLASLVAIAKGDVPVDHWYAMSRPYVYSSGGQTLLSWSGTMFEYMMPLLFTRTYANSLLDHACHDAVRRQIEYGNENGIPWGISESAWSALDSHQIYQYRAFGVPVLALNPGTEEELVVSPYSSVLAMLIDPAAGADNLERLQGLGLGGPMGFYESIDFSRENRKNGERGVTIFCYMAHHQGMSLNALDNVLHRDVMQRRFHGDLRIRAVESLLFEGIPITRHPIEETRSGSPAVHVVSPDDAADRVWTEETAAPRVHLHGNGRYALMITNSGGGYSRWGDFDLTRWRSDPTLDPWGSFLYVRDLKSDELWATTHKPLQTRAGELSVRFASDRAEIHRRLSGVETVLDITVASEDDVELRRLRVTNRSLRSRQLEFTSYVELAMTYHGADKAHPAFVKMFIETENPAPGVLLAHRRPRDPKDPPIWTAHVLVLASEQTEQRDDIQHETDRGRFLGRGNSPENPAALKTRLSGSVGTVIDPIFSLRCRVDLDPRERQELTFLTIAASSRETLMELVAKYQVAGAVSRAFEMAWTRAQLEFRFLRIGPGAAHRFQELASQMIYPNPRLRPPTDRMTRNRLGQESLWTYGISGDLPILVVTLSDGRSLSLVREVLLAHAYWRLRGFKADVIILNQEGPSYDQPLKIELQRQIQAHASEAGTDRPGGVFLRDWHAIPEEHRALILACACILLSGSRGSLQQQLVPVPEGPVVPPFVPASGSGEEPSRPLPFLELPYFNGLGGFTADGREYAIYLKPGATTPAPWINVMANEHFGALVGESGLGFTWSQNSQANRLTPWHNDPVSDPQSEVIYMRDDDSGAIWTPTALPRREKDAYRARHGQGYTVFEHNSHAIGLEATVFVPVGENGAGDPLKVCRLRLRNDSSRSRRLTVTWFVEWTLGPDREEQQIHIQSSRDTETGALLARQYWNGGARGRWAFAATNPQSSSSTCDRGQFLGRDGTRSNPAALDRARLDNRCGTGADPCAAHQLKITLDHGQQTEVVFLLGQADDLESVRAILKRFESPGEVETALDGTRRWWDSLLGSLQVRTPVLSVDLLLNRWLLYQSLSCRFWGCSALYQSGGAFGFRDQLQDSMAFVYSAPQITRKHILAAAARQFPEGDVQHWWHPDTGVGVRTLCSDDLLWLPFVVAQYVKVTHDLGILDESVPFIDGPALAEHEHERMITPTVSAQTAPLWEHCRRALDHGLGERGKKTGPHGLPLMGNGDWNDGMNLVGAEGRGESVWLGWFLCAVLDSFAGLMENRPAERHFAAGWRQQITALKNALEESAWDGEWYLRAYFDNGAPLGSHANQEARIDSLPQSWSVISGAGDPARARQAMESAEANLVRERDRLVLLFTPPFDHSEPNPGYIMGYPPGLRENGGQYTHGSLWLAMAWARLGEGEKAVRLLQLMNPIELNRGPADLERYRGEPYVAAADISSAANHVGQSGWTWYTGSAAWMYRIWMEEVLGFQLRGDRFTLKPSLPAAWPGFELTYRRGSTTWEIKVGRLEGEAMPLFELDGEEVTSGFIPIEDTGGTHQVVVRLTQPAAPTDLDSSPQELQTAGA
ncbi:MAG TPA: glucoamylase family protein [Bryobacteraceae bacterium]|nr:glucoamylase family protein [Bryobacteraceae bacterium]